MLKLVIDEPSHINFIITYVKISYFFWLTDDMHDALKYMHPDLVICSFNVKVRRKLYKFDLNETNS